MITDHLSNLKLYVQVHPLLKIISEYIREHDLMTLPSGRTEIMGNDLFVLRETYSSKPETECTFEGHLRYGDVQIVLAGSESIGYHPKNVVNYSVTSPYNDDKDIEKYLIPSYTPVQLHQGMFAIVFPNDLHMPKLMNGQSSLIEKVVFKFNLSYQGGSSWQKL